ncbi:MAG: SDR family oxidoreductase [Sphingomonadales bacterium]|nr:SDR family oxidoreductase [Sphingomonadales bacterium]
MQPQLEAEFDLAGRVAVITGAASGIGRETARTLAEAGAAVVIADIDAAGLAETASLVEQAGGRVATRACNVASRAEVEALADAAMSLHGRVDCWVNVAGILVRQMILDVREEDLDRVVAVNLKGVYWGIAAAGRVMKDAGPGRKPGGSIINLSSSGGESAIPMLSVYSLTKAAVNALTRTAARELGPFGIRVNAIAPGWVDTPLGNGAFHDGRGQIDPEKQRVGLAQREATSPLGITGVPRDIALAALYLAADASRFMTGQIMRPNGGVSMP